MGLFGLFSNRNDTHPTPLKSSVQEWMGDENHERVMRLVKLYDRYEGKQVFENYQKPDDLQYQPTLLTINYDRLLVDTMAAWEFEMAPKHDVSPGIIDDPIDMASEAYEESAEQDAENRRAAAKELLINRVHNDNRSHEKLLEAAKDRKIAGTVWIKLAYDKRTGKIRLAFRPDLEVVAKWSMDDADTLEEVHFFKYLDAELTKMWRQSYRMDTNPTTGAFECYVHEATYDVTDPDAMEIVEEHVAYQSMGLDFIPVVDVPNEKLAGMTRGYSEIDKYADITDEINRKLSDYSDAIRFEMFAITLLMNVDDAKGLKTAPGALWNIVGDGGLLEGQLPEVKKLESNFRFKEATEAYLDRLYANLHKIAEVPSVNTAEMNVGGINDMAVKLLFSAIISKTQRSWVIWRSRLQLLNEYILRYMQARQDDVNFAYDKAQVAQIDDNYDNQVHFRLPLPEDQVALVNRLTTEMASDLESIKGAMARNGIENPEAKLMEIMAEKRMMQANEDPYMGAFATPQVAQPAAPKAEGLPTE